MDFRIESDFIGKVKVPVNAYYGAYTARVLENYAISDQLVPTLFLKNYIGIKRAYAQVNFSNQKLPKEKAVAIIEACNTFLMKDGLEFMSNFPIDIYQSGGGTSTNMMINEVIANYAEEVLGGKKGEYKMIHPNDHVNMSQSSNDTFPATMRITFLTQILELIEVLSATTTILAAIAAKADALKLKKVGRTHLQDAVEMEVSQEFKAFQSTIKNNIYRLKRVAKKLKHLPLGGTAIGSFQNSSAKISEAVIDEISSDLNMELKPAKNFYESISTSSDFAETSSVLALLSQDLIKMINDLRLLSAGPNAFLNEYKFPPAQPGSSIMPGKVNPSIMEATEMAAFRVIGLNKTVEIASMSAQLQLQQFNPIIAWSIFESFEILRESIRNFAVKDLAKLEFNEVRIAENLEKSLVDAVKYSEKLGYSLVSKKMHENDQHSTTEILKSLEDKP